MKKQLITVTATVGILFTTAFYTQASAHELNYQIQSGDTLWKIATANNISVQDLQTWNNLQSSNINIGQKLTLVSPHSHVDYGSYTVKAGDSLYIIATNHNTSVTELKSINQLNTDLINIGQVLKVPSSTTQSEIVTAPKTYTVKSGDSLWQIASKNGLTIQQLKTFNGLTSDNIMVGQVLKLTSDGTTAPSPAPVVTKTLNVDALITEGKKYIGTPYVWGGSTPSGFDCSGFLNYVYSKVGVSIPRTVETIWGATTSVTTPQPGDIVFYNTSNAGPSHAGIYIGDNKFLHAGSSTGVTITDMNNPYWKARYLGVKKVKL